MIKWLLLDKANELLNSLLKYYQCIHTSVGLVVGMLNRNICSWCSRMLILLCGIIHNCLWLLRFICLITMRRSVLIIPYTRIIDLWYYPQQSDSCIFDQFNSFSRVIQWKTLKKIIIRHWSNLKKKKKNETFVNIIS